MSLSTYYRIVSIVALSRIVPPPLPFFNQEVCYDIVKIRIFLIHNNIFSSMGHNCPKLCNIKLH